MQGTITKRVVNRRRHTKAYVVAGARITRGTAVKMARRGKLANVTAKRGPDGWYITGLPSAEFRLYDLPVVVEV